MFVVSSKQMKAAEQAYVDSGACEFLPLMERAGSAASKVILQRENPSKAVVLCGNGNNGGDGFVIARHLSSHGFWVTVVLTMGRPKTDNAKTMMDRLPADVVVLDAKEKGEAAKEAILAADFVVDAVFGIGFHGKLPSPVSEFAELCRKQCKRVYAVDLPSGANADTGAVEGECFSCVVSITFAAKKQGHLLYPGAGYCGEVVVADIGIGTPIFSSLYIESRTITRKMVSAAIPDRKADANKGDFGKLMLLAGSASMMGAAQIAAKAALRCSAGLVTLAAPRRVTRTLTSSIPEAVMFPLKMGESGAISSREAKRIVEHANSMSAIAAGCGMSWCEDTRKVIETVIREVEIPLVLDADALNVISEYPEILHTRKAPTILTPHPGEMARLCSKTISEVQADRIGAALSFSKQYGVITVLKGAYTVIATNDGRVYFNETGNSGLSRGGSGDMLTGIIGALLAQGIPAEKAAVSGVYLHGLSADLCAQKMSQYAMLATDVIESLSDAFLQIKGR
ncbi:MAG TPA: NAD(P)H-hydrate dehydratase [Firmicutes bacterium]|nr:NAD(P)H-hydrate dehydratase [Bacillota bacterium]